MARDDSIHYSVMYACNRDVYVCMLARRVFAMLFLQNSDFAPSQVMKENVRQVSRFTSSFFFRFEQVEKWAKYSHRR